MNSKEKVLNNQQLKHTKSERYKINEKKMGKKSDMCVRGNGPSEACRRTTLLLRQQIEGGYADGTRSPKE